jgi:hypothetical protein
MPAAEFETGKLTIAAMQSDAFGLAFRANNQPDRTVGRQLRGGS